MGLQELRLEPRRMFAEARTAVSEQRGHVREVFGPGVDGQGWHMGPWVGGHCRGAACTGPAQAPGCVLHVSPPQTAGGQRTSLLPTWPPRQRCAFALPSAGPSWGRSTLSRGSSYILGLLRAGQPMQLTGRGARAGLRRAHPGWGAPPAVSVSSWLGWSPRAPRMLEGIKKCPVCN